MKNSGGNFRAIADPFTMVSNKIIEDKGLSMKAKGLYLIIKHYISIPGFALNKSYLMGLSKEGERAFDSTWKELKEAGYLKQYRTKSLDGKWVYEYELLHSPVFEINTEAKEETKREIREEIKKSSTSVKANDYNNKIKNCKKNITNNSIQQSKEKYTDKQREILNILNSNNISNIQIKEALELFTDIDRLNDCINKCEGRSKAYNYLKAVYKNSDNQKENKVNNNSHRKTKFHNFNETFTQYSEEEFDSIIERAQKAKFKENENKETDLYSRAYMNVVKEYGEETVKDMADFVLEIEIDRQLKKIKKR